jgi:hypothetical protein
MLFYICFLRAEGPISGTKRRVRFAVLGFANHGCDRGERTDGLIGLLAERRRIWRAGGAVEAVREALEQPGCPGSRASLVVSVTLHSPPDPIEPWEVLDLLAGLVPKSLVLYEEDEQGGGRYRLLETVRQYARDRLLESSCHRVVPSSAQAGGPPRPPGRAGPDPRARSAAGSPHCRGVFQYVEWTASWGISLTKGSPRSAHAPDRVCCQPSWRATGHRPLRRCAPVPRHSSAKRVRSHPLNWRTSNPGCGSADPVRRDRSGICCRFRAFVINYPVERDPRTRAPIRLRA